jgi:hypothetical protein
MWEKFLWITEVTRKLSIFQCQREMDQRICNRYRSPWEDCGKKRMNQELDFGVMGWTANGRIQVVPGYEDVSLYTAPLIFQEYSWDKVIQFASENRVYSKPRYRKNA